MPTVVSPVRAPVHVLAEAVADPTTGAAPRSVTSLVLETQEPVFRGHYPGFPIFPGVCLIECVHRSCLTTAPGTPRAVLTLAAVESTRFLGAVFPGDRIVIESTWTAISDGWRVTARIRGDRGDVAAVRLRYHTGEAG
ncbi:hypothetical protein HC031_13215 [Planosporangium thailandense]|uniref:ApeI dehydratase-like domain-containing protein n=1 Tax=Planosporangium thailandense TaxID=765197 RepID=A0ABX0XXA6_9ACTN|nr:hypothetical protein [Planosporangium thailandense]NJC70665.1 hypothetical protein [Planosporangium thailandense]